MPVFWMNELSGRMRAIVKAFFSEDQALNADEIDVLKRYLAQWIAALPKQPPNWRRELAACQTKEDLRRFNWELVSNYGIDAF